MKKQLILSTVVFGLACASVFAQGIDPVAMDRIDTITKGKNNGDQITSLRVKGSGQVDGTLTVGTLSNTGAQTTARAVVSSWETVAGNRTLVGDTTNSERIAHGGWTNGGSVSFAVPFTGTPDVFLTYTTAPGTNLAVVATVNPTNFTTLGVTSAGKYIAIGVK